MKKIIALLVLAVMLFALVSCGGNETSNPPVNESKEESTDKAESKDESVPVESTPEESVPDESMPDESASETSEEQSEDASDDTSVPETSEEEKVIPEFVSNFVSWDKLDTKLKATDAKSIRLTGVNKDAGYGDVIIYTYEYAGDRVTVKDGNYSDYAYLIAEYDTELMGVVKKSVKAVGSVSDNSSLTVPDDGFIIAAHKEQPAVVSKLNECAEGVTLFAAGVQTCDVNYSIKKTDSPITVDGKIDNEWTAHKIDTIDETNPRWSYSNFVGGEYYTTAEYFVTYDNDYIYLAVEVTSPYHHCPLKQDAANSMWKYECIQVKMSIESPKSDYIREHYDHVADKTAETAGIVRAYGFAVNNDGETIYYENSTANKVFGGKVACTRDDGAQLTVYEVAIPWEEYGVSVDELEKVGLTFSVNSTNEEDIQTGNWRNLVLRDGGGVIGRNDWAKIPEVTLN